jgi:cyclopropane-fatty-acyl-phospholipid synthase
MGEYPSKDFAVRLWDGTIWPKNSQQSEQHPAFTMVLSHPGSLRSIFLPPTELTLGEAYIYGDFDVEGDLIAAFSQHYVFPDGELVPISVSLSAAEAAGFEVRDVESLREHYALTLRNWVR